MWTQPWFWSVWIAVAGLMEFWAMFVHGRVWHRLLWFAHRSHHETREGAFEGNDVFAVIHALFAMTLIIAGIHHAPVWGWVGEMMAAVGFGMTTFGVSYFVIHDGFIHQRLPVAFLGRFSAIPRIRTAHLVHHQREHAGPYGLFLGQWELRRVARANRRNRQIDQGAAR